MKLRTDRRDLLALACVVIAAVLLVAATGLKSSPADTDSAARRVERIVSYRMSKLEKYVSKPPRKMPADMIVYLYEGDTLRYWTNQFPVTNDDIRSKVMFSHLVNPRYGLDAPLVEISDSLGFYNFGECWYLAKSVPVSETSKALIGLEIINPQRSRAYNGTNPKLHIGDRFSVKPLTFSEGTSVSAGGSYQFKILYDSLSGSVSADPTLVWLAYAFFLAAAIAFVYRRRTLARFAVAATGVLAITACMYAWGRSQQFVLPVFSPTLFSGGQLMFSLGALCLVNLAILIIFGLLYVVRRDIISRIRTTTAYVICSVAAGVGIIAVALYTHLTLRSLILNSSISLELYKFGQVSVWSGVVYLSFLGEMSAIPLLIQLLQPAVSRLTGRHFNVMSVKGKIVYAVLASLYLVGMAGFTGLDKEQDRLESRANRIVVDRDITLELQLKRVEDQIATDLIIPALLAFDNSSSQIRNRILETYLTRLPQQNYDVDVILMTDPRKNPQLADFFLNHIRDGQPISEGSHFVYSETDYGHSHYDGVFAYYVDGVGVARMMLEIEPKTSGTGKGYARLTNMTPPGKVSMPAFYSFARYVDNQLHIYRGSFAYPTNLTGNTLAEVHDKGAVRGTIDGYTHFIYEVTDGEVVIISRPKDEMVGYAIAFVAVALLAYALLTLLTFGQVGKRQTFEKTYYKPRIILILMSSLLLTMIVMATVSVVFVTRRNEANLRTIISERVTSIQQMLEDGLRGVRDIRKLSPPDYAALNTLLGEVALSSSTDVTVFDTSGRLLMSTSPELYSRLIGGCRISSEAYNQIVNLNKRYFINKEKIGRRSYYGMYAPIHGEGGKLIGIMSSPYTGVETYDFERDALMHSFTILMVFVLMLIVSGFLATTIVEKLFQPLSVMSRKMEHAGLESLEYIDYDRDDEITSLVQSYNRMVTDLSESTRQLAQAERDKAWSGMARQVAHEIKNPLTPMKLQLQRLIRLKQKGDASWQEKFDDVAKVLLDHIDILTDTANEFSTFAKLYTEEPTELDLDAVLQEEISMFDNKDGVSFGYMGIEGAKITGPKPQLIRVFVNLIGNAVQALEGRTDGQVLVAVRMSREAGFYDIVVEDNGPGVAPDNVPKLFTPNFTTKNAGSGLGLAISRSILEKCGATISYSRSFSLGGACFTIKYPR